MVAIVRSTDLTERQEKLVQELVQGSTIEAASIAAGYAAVSVAKQILRSENVALAFQQRMAERLGMGAPGMFAVLQEIATNRALPAGPRVDAAKAWLDRAGWTVPRGVEKASGDKALHEMSAEELKRTVLELKALQAAPIGPPEGASLDDMLS